MLRFTVLGVMAAVLLLGGCSWLSSAFVVLRVEGPVVSDVCGFFIASVEMSGVDANEDEISVRYTPVPEAAMVELNLLAPGPSVDVVGEIPNVMPSDFSVLVETSRPGGDTLQHVIEVRDGDLGEADDVVAAGVTTRGEASEVIPSLLEGVNCDAGTG